MIFQEKNFSKGLNRFIRLAELTYEYVEFYTFLFLKKIKCGGARIVTVDKFGNHIISLVRRSLLGERHQEIVVSADSVLLYNVQLFGVYEKSLITLFRRHIKHGTIGATFLDIGANCGLIALGVSNNNPKISQVIAVEPITQNSAALEVNLSRLKVNYLIHKYGLSNDTTNNEIYIPADQFGSATLIPQPGSGQKLKIDLVSPCQFYRNELADLKNLYIKCDIEGKDVEVLSNFPAEVWENVVAVSFEISRGQLEQISEVIALLGTLRKAGLENFYLESRFPRLISIDEIKALTMDSTRSNWNIFACRK